MSKKERNVLFLFMRKNSSEILKCWLHLRGCCQEDSLQSNLAVSQLNSPSTGTKTWNSLIKWNVRLSLSHSPGVLQIYISLKCTITVYVTKIIVKMGQNGTLCPSKRIIGNIRHMCVMCRYVT